MSLSSTLILSFMINYISFMYWCQYLSQIHLFQGWQSFIIALINQLAVNLKRIHGLGVQKIAVTGLQPLGCLPARTANSSFRKCNATENSLVSFHNLLLQQAVAKLNNETSTGRSSFVILDLYDSFMSVLENKGTSYNPSFYLFIFL